MYFTCKYAKCDTASAIRPTNGLIEAGLALGGGGNVTLQAKLMWAGIAALGVISFAIVALTRGEPVNAAWLVIASVCIYVIAYRFYGLFVANVALGVDAGRQTPAYRRNDGLDYVPTNRYVLFGHHFAAIAGAGPLVGPVLAAQMGYLPGTLWILVGVVFAGAVQDMTVLFLSTRRDGRSLGDMIRSEIGPVAGGVASFGVLLICVILLAVLALVVVKALTGSPWGVFTVFCTVPIALIMGVHSRFIRPGRIGEMSAIGAVLLLAALVFGRTVAENPALAPYFNLSDRTLALIDHRLRLRRLGAAGMAVAGAARLSLDIPEGRHGRLLAVGIVIVRPDLQMPAVTSYHRRQWAGVGGRPVPVPVHHHRLRLGVGLARADLLRHDAENDREREPNSLHRLWRHVDGVVRRHHGDDRRLGAASGRLFRHEQRGGAHRHNRRFRVAGDLVLGLRRHARRSDPDRP